MVRRCRGECHVLMCGQVDKGRAGEAGEYQGQRFDYATHFGSKDRRFKTQWRKEERKHNWVCMVCSSLPQLLIDIGVQNIPDDEINGFAIF